MKTPSASKPREYPHTSGDRNASTASSSTRKRVSGGGEQEVASPGRGERTAPPPKRGTATPRG